MRARNPEAWRPLQEDPRRPRLTGGKTIYKRILPAIAALLLLTLSGVVISCGGDDEGQDNGDATLAPTSSATSTGGETAEPTPSTSELPSATTDGSTPAEGATTVTVNLSEYILSPSPGMVSAGPVTFIANNIGGTVHELIVLQTDLASDALPTRDDGSVDGEGTGFETIGESEDVPLQEQRQFTAELASGNYVLLCNIVETTSSGASTSHYAEGMHSVFTVQ